MKHILKDDTDHLKLLHTLFQNIKSGETILFLGAGASITNKKYLSQELMRLYEAKVGIKLDTDDIIEFVDILQSKTDFDRNEFDNFVEQQLRRLEVSDSHSQIAAMPWNQIITTNYDVLLERAFEKSNDQNELDLKVIRSKEESYYTADGSQLKYIKLNGCISDKSKYPLVFSSEDFANTNSYYKEIFNGLKGMSDRINFISIGYSYTDKLSSYILRKIDQTNFRQRRTLFNVDPSVNENRLDFYADNNVCVINYPMEDFFKEYKKWDTKEGSSIVKSKKIQFTNAKNNIVMVEPKLALKTHNVIRQLHEKSRHPNIREVEFYLGEEPNYDTIRRGFDIKRKKEIGNITNKIKTAVNNSEILIPVIFGRGIFGSGKTTIGYQVIQSLLNNDEFDCVVFEVEDYFKLNAGTLVELFTKINSRYVLLYFNEAEIDSHFRILADLRFELSSRQLHDCKVIFYVSIRGNILERHKKTRHFANAIEVNHKSSFEIEELDELIDKLKEINLITLRDKKSKGDLINRVLRNYSGDSFLTLTNLITNGNHDRILVDAYDELSDKTKQAFIYTSLTYRFKMRLPASILLNLMSSDWGDFRENIIKADGKGLLFNEIDDSRNASHDMYFKTKHSYLSEILISKVLTKTSEQFKYYNKLINSISYSHDNSNFTIDLLKAITKYNIFESSQINALSDIAYKKFDEEPYFHLYYAMNLQKRRSLEYLHKAIDILLRGESLLSYRNHRFIHRRAVINFDIAKAYFRKEKDELKKTLRFLDEADDLFELKQSIDPFSSFSYTDFIRYKIWVLENIKYEEKEEELKIKTRIEELIDFGVRAVRDNQNRILSLQSEYIEKFRYKRINSKKYENELKELYEDAASRPYALVLLTQYYIDNNQESKAEQQIEELEQYIYVEDVVRYLFKYYGRRLFDPTLRNKFYELIGQNNFLEEKEGLRYHYFSYIAESYYSNFKRSYSNLRSLKDFNFINPDYNEEWKDEDGITQVFDGRVINDKGRKAIRVGYFPKTFYIDTKCNVIRLKVNQLVRVTLKFYLFGIKASVI